MHEPLHPGEIIKDALFEDTGLTVTEAAKQLKIDRTTLSRLINGHTGISADMAYRLAIFLDTSPDLWINIQKDYELWCVKDKAKKFKITPLKKLKKAA